MLIEIQCDKFITKKIKFKKGLNAVLGDNLSTNSIGKSTMLMIIDFIFGGSSFLKENFGSINELGNLEFKFLLKFGRYSYFFIRSTEHDQILFRCNKDYQITDEIEIDEYTLMLRNLYNLSPNSSFRAAVNPYSRIWKKDNYSVDKPITNHPKEKEQTAIENLIKLFDLYDNISLYVKEIKNKSQSKKVLAGVFSTNLIPKVTKKLYIQNQTEIESVENEIAHIKDSLTKFTLNVEGLLNKEILELKSLKFNLNETLSVINGKLSRLDLNLNENRIKSIHFSRLSQFFDNLNEDKIYKIEEFHNKISEILKRELLNTKKTLIEEQSNIESQIQKIDERLDKLFSKIDTPDFIVDKIYDLTLKASKLSEINEFYDKKEAVTEEIKQLSAEYTDELGKILGDIESLINVELTLLNKRIHHAKKKVPKIILKPKTYRYDHSSNTGTGKSFSDLIEFDLAILNLTNLPFLIHDSILFKNIEDKAIDKIIDQYSEFNKQIFIAIDGINKFSMNSKQILNESCVIQLSDSRRLFNRDWS
ncbi:hypothetical protein KJK34_11305 [Flavobacterium sp. D11R37]|uniref:DUF2326 domain-containing protein n=1 Tax=Flavobacterium coralii TaxID=2838017 RepID=UPI001CA6FC20|nr:DUF2326 domain-containing protein [Flavobacterium coralii]MBY8963341.1 hypothetical protein [Flavobacterium coralii]